MNYPYSMTIQNNQEEFSKRVAKRIKELRTGGKEKLTQEELAYRANMDTTSFSRIERGQNPDVRLMTLDRIIKALDVDYPTFFTFTDDEKRKNRIIAKLDLVNDDTLLEIIENLLDREFLFCFILPYGQIFSTFPSFVKGIICIF